MLTNQLLLFSVGLDLAPALWLKLISKCLYFYLLFTCSLYLYLLFLCIRLDFYSLFGVARNLAATLWPQLGRQPPTFDTHAGTHYKSFSIRTVRVIFFLKTCHTL